MQAAVAPAPFPRGTSPSPGHSTLGAPPGKVPNPRFNGTSAPGVDYGNGAAVLSAPMAAPLSRVKQTGEQGQPAAKSFQATPGKEPNPRLINGTHPGTPRAPLSFIEQLQAGAPASAPSSGGASGGRPASMHSRGGQPAGEFQAKVGNATNPRLKGAPPPHALRAFQAKTGKKPSPGLTNSTGVIPPASHSANSTMLSAVTGPEDSSSAASAARDGGTGSAVPSTVKHVEGDTVLITRLAAPEDAASAPERAPASSAAVQAAPAQAPALASPQRRPPQTSKTAPVILESIPLQATLEQLESRSRGLLAAGGANDTAVSAPAAPPPASSASSMAAFRSALAAELSAASRVISHLMCVLGPTSWTSKVLHVSAHPHPLCEAQCNTPEHEQLHAYLQAAAAPAPSADVAAQAPSPVASAVASLAARVDSGQASPALVAQLQETQTLLDIALLVR